MFVAQLIIFKTIMEFKNLYLYLLYNAHTRGICVVLQSQNLHMGEKKTLHINSAHDPGDIYYRYDDLEN